MFSDEISFRSLPAQFGSITESELHFHLSLSRILRSTTVEMLRAFFVTFF